MTYDAEVHGSVFLLTTFMARVTIYNIETRQKIKKELHEFYIGQHELQVAVVQFIAALENFDDEIHEIQPT